MNLPLVGRTYKHFEGGYYRIIVIAWDHETLSPVVIYQSVDNDGYYARPLESFSEMVGDVERFALV